ncbi:hypothetical protein OH76DRAFT_1206067 [Lentinus brumalis]|uniref:BTB domain-containing protein n=1 Tax=Lentinus brumalis TaxID=2498619 RepID=A0A371CSU4_9APHY|nr:hypothetical protein OH76DRAFT_1206067 [Polyporus brumalis]
MSSGPPLDSIAAESVADQRTDNDLVRDTEFWFEGGSVVIVAGRVAFKVYRETLAVPSVVFQGMFQFPPNVVVLTFDGCPVVRVSDSPEDFRHLLRVPFHRPKSCCAGIPCRVDVAVHGIRSRRTSTCNPVCRLGRM